MSENDYFHESIPDGIANAIYEYDQEIECANQDAHEILIMTFGKDFRSDSLKNAGNDSFEAFAFNMKKWFELEVTPSATDAKNIIAKALAQWGG